MHSFFWDTVYIRGGSKTWLFCKLVTRLCDDVDWRYQLRREFTTPVEVRNTVQYRTAGSSCVSVRTITTDRLERVDLLRLAVVVHLTPQPGDHPRGDPPPRGRSLPTDKPREPTWWRWTGRVELFVAGRSSDGFVECPVDSVENLRRRSQFLRPDVVDRYEWKTETSTAFSGRRPKRRGLRFWTGGHRCESRKFFLQILTNFQPVSEIWYHR